MWQIMCIYREPYRSDMTLLIQITPIIYIRFTLFSTTSPNSKYYLSVKIQKLSFDYSNSQRHLSQYRCVSSCSSRHFTDHSSSIYYSVSYSLTASSVVMLSFVTPYSDNSYGHCFDDHPCFRIASTFTHGHLLDSQFGGPRQCFNCLPQTPLQQQTRTQSLESCRDRDLGVIINITRLDYHLFDFKYTCYDPTAKTFLASVPSETVCIYGLFLIVFFVFFVTGMMIFSLLSRSL